MRRRGSATRHGRPISASSAARRSGCSPAAPRSRNGRSRSRRSRRRSQLPGRSRRRGRPRAARALILRAPVADGAAMDTRDFVLVQGIEVTRETLARWSARPWPVLGAWFLGALAISSLLLLAVLVVSSAVSPDIGFRYVPSRPQGFELHGMAETMGRNSLVLALHAVACVAGFIAGSSLPLSAERRTGLSRDIH